MQTAKADYIYMYMHAWFTNDSFNIIYINQIKNYCICQDASLHMHAWEKVL